jgi:hypothetical protein
VGSCRNELNRLPKHDRRDGAEVVDRRSRGVGVRMWDDARAGVALGSKHGFIILGRAIRASEGDGENVAR